MEADHNLPVGRRETRRCGERNVCYHVHSAPVKYLCRVPRPLGIVQFGHDVITVVATAELLKEN